MTLELNDMLDACSDREARRRLFKTFPKEYHDAIIAEHAARTEDRVAPIGSLVAPLNQKRGINIVARRHGGATYATSYDLAVVIGQPEHGSAIRLLWFPVPWEDREGTIIHWAEASSHDLKVVTTMRKR